MRYSHLLLMLSVVLFGASSAWAQYGLYGSPEMLRLPPTSPQTTPRYAYPSTLFESYNSGATPQFDVAGKVEAVPGTADALPPDAAGAEPNQMVYAPGASPKGSPKPTPKKVQPLKKLPLLEKPKPEASAAVEQKTTAKQTPDEPTYYPSTSDCHEGCGEHCGSPCRAGFGLGLGRGGGSFLGKIRGEGCDDGCGFGTFGRAVAESCSQGCGSPGCCDSLWYARAAWLIMGRNKPNRLWTSYETNNNPNQLTNTADIDLSWGNGGEISIGRLFCCGAWAVEGTFWGLDTLTGSVSTTHPNTVSTPLDFSDVVYANPAIPGTPSELFDTADEHRLSRENEFYNVELNLVRNPTDCGPVDVDWMVGIRYFRFEEHLNFDSVRTGGSWANPDETGHMRDRIVNSLVGFQFGFDLDYQCHEKLRLFVTPKFGIYNNQINNRFRAYRGDGELFAPDPFSGVPGSYPVNSTTNALSFLTQLDLGLDWQFTPCWSAFAGYRVVVATGIGLADNQFPPYVVDIPEIEDIDYNGELVLHGAFAGVSYAF